MRSRLNPFRNDGVKVVGETFVVVDNHTNRPYGAAREFGSAAEAHDHMASVVESTPTLAGRLQVVPASEAA